ncbi:hypothetical protein [Desulfonatronum sp. SC1]|uniref:hypothetical protein n=1 Tax=Desulfonatronum sp. SC1 TaxID=2109626 RepID=UPI000D2FE3B7|nr:hypothetical protein [Desulfonatronum sp. SC1]PTN37741.1 hypothetical protein C6366_05740 [Desulfonatronum sp. SC1]
MHGMEVIYVCPLNPDDGARARESAEELYLSGDGAVNCIDVWTCPEREGNIVILLYKDQEPGMEELSPEGARIADFFSRFGLVSHTRWSRV